MGKILYRAKSVESESYHDVEIGQWLYGLPTYYTDFDKIDGIDVGGEGVFKIDPKTLSRYIFMDDDNDVPIFTNDIVRICGGEQYHGVWEFDNTFIITDYVDYCMFYDMEHITIVGNVIDSADFKESDKGVEWLIG